MLFVGNQAVECNATRGKRLMTPKKAPTAGRRREGRNATSRTADDKEMLKIGRALMSAGQGMTCRLDAGGRVVSVGAKLLERLQYRREEVVGKDAKEIIAPEHRRRSLVAFGRYLSGHPAAPFRIALVARNGNRLHVEICAVPILSPDGRVSGLLAILHDVSALRKLKERFASLERVHHYLMQHIPAGVALLTADLKVIEASARLRRRKRLPPPDGQVRCYGYYCIPPRTEPCIGCPALAALSDGKEHTIEAEWNEGTEELAVKLTASPVLDGNGKAVALVELVQDITEQRRSQDELVRLARLDGLTKVFNRGFFQDILAKEMSHLQRYGGRLGLMYVDVDHLKLVNDRLGHAAGDEVLRVVGRILKENVRKADTVARYGGDEFVVLMPHAHANEAWRPVKRIKRAVARWNAQPTVLGAFLSLSIGRALGGRDDCGTLIERADALMYEDKRRNKEHLAMSERTTKRLRAPRRRRKPTTKATRD